MTLQGAVVELKGLMNQDDIPFYYKGAIQKVIETIQMDCKEIIVGEWIADEDGNIYCSVCGRNGVGESFCEHCGAKMEEKVETFPYLIGEDAEMFVDGEWIRGKITSGYRFKDGIVTIETPAGKRYWCGEARKELYRKVEGNV